MDVGTACHNIGWQRSSLQYPLILCHSAFAIREPWPNTVRLPTGLPLGTCEPLPPLEEPCGVSLACSSTLRQPSCLLRFLLRTNARPGRGSGLACVPFP